MRVGSEAPNQRMESSTEAYGKAMTGVQKVLAMATIPLMYLCLFALFKAGAWLHLITFIPLWFIFTKFIGVAPFVALLRARRHTRIHNFKRKLALQFCFWWLINIFLWGAGYEGHYTYIGALVEIGALCSGFSIPMSYILPEQLESNARALARQQQSQTTS